MRNYEVHYENTEIRMTVEANSPEEAYLIFLEDSEKHENAVHVIYKSILDNKETIKVFTEHVTDSTKIKTEINDNPQLIIEKLDRINANLLSIQWLVLGIGVMFALIFIVPQFTGS